MAFSINRDGVEGKSSVDDDHHLLAKMASLFKEHLPLEDLSYPALHRQPIDFKWAL